MSGPVVVGYDGAETAPAVLARAIEEAAGSRGTLVVVAVAAMLLDPEGPMAYGTLDDGPVPSLPLVEPPEIEHALAEARRQIDAAGVPAEYVWEAGDPAAAIVREARDRGAELIVVGKGHHNRLARWLGADVAVGVEKAAGCRVLVVDS